MNLVDVGFIMDKLNCGAFRSKHKNNIIEVTLIFQFWTISKFHIVHQGSCNIFINANIKSDLYDVDMQSDFLYFW